MRSVVVYPDAATVATATAARLLTHLTDVLAHQERADVVLTGGTVGIATLREAAASPIATAVDWTAVHLWWGDERFVPAGHPDRNEGQAQDALIAHLPIPQENVHRVGASDAFASLEEAAASYAAEFGATSADVLMLGMGPDGHVASLFPGHPVFTMAPDPASGSAVAVHDSPKPPPMRVSLTLTAINRAKKVWLVAAGAEKADAVARSLQGDTTLPAATVAGVEQTLWLLDVDAASRA
jgi:6-phosphogluconolactonase